MILARTLNIGNAVFKDNNIHKVVKEDFLNVNERGFVEHLKPIPLTLELLPKIDTSLINDYKGAFIFNQEPESETYSFFYQVNGKARRIYFLHELQNIIFDLSEKELNFL